MWITTITYDLVAIRQLSDSDIASLFSSVQNKKDELKAIDGDGKTTAEYPVPTDFNNILLNQTTLIIKRTWNQQVNAQALVDHLAGISHVTATVEEQA